MTPRAQLEIFAPDGAGEIEAGAELAGFVIALCTGSGLALLDGDIVILTSKAVSKAEGRVGPGDRLAAIQAETRRVVAQRGETQIVRSRLGIVQAAAGVDDSGVAAGHIALLPCDPDDSAERIRQALTERTGLRLGVLISDTSGRPWRNGQTDFAIGAAGLEVIEDHRGKVDEHGNLLRVTMMAVADELCAAAELATGKLGRRPVAVVRGRPDLVLSASGAPAVALQRPAAEDWFGYGAREAVLAALAGDPDTLSAFGAPAPAAEVSAAIEALTGRRPEADPNPSQTLHYVGDPSTDDTVRAVAHAHGWLSEQTTNDLRLRATGPVP